jgi:hypothetical protein
VNKQSSLDLIHLLFLYEELNVLSQDLTPLLLVT